MKERITSLSICLLTALMATPVVPASAFPPPIAATTASTRLLQGVSDNSSELSYSPVMLQIARLIGRIGLSPSFFLQDGGIFSSEPGVDLRTLLLYQAGLIKLPVNVRKSKGAESKNEQTPSLTVSGIPDPQFPANGAQAHDVPNVDSSPIPDSDAEQATGGNGGESHLLTQNKQRRMQPQQNGELLNIDIRALQSETPRPSATQAKAPQLIADNIPHLAMALPAPPKTPSLSNPQFRLWTWSEDQSAAASSDATSAIDNHQQYDGSFILATRGAITSIKERQFGFSGGRMIASNADGEMVLKTPLGSVILKRGAIAMLELSKQENGTVLKVLALEPQATPSIFIHLIADKEHVIDIEQGDGLICSDRPLSEQDLAVLKRDGNAINSATIALGKFALAQWVQHEPLLQAISKENAERHAALTALKQKLEAPHATP